MAASGRKALLQAVTLPPPLVKPALRLLGSSYHSVLLGLYYPSSISTIHPGILEVLVGQGTCHETPQAYGGFPPSSRQDTNPDLGRTLSN